MKIVYFTCLFLANNEVCKDRTLGGGVINY